MSTIGKATRIDLTDFKSPQMRVFHLSWFAFFLSFFAWFGIAPLMPVVREDLGLSKAQIGNTIIASVAITILVRLLAGVLCDKWGPRITYSGLLILGSLPVMSIGLAHDYQSFLIFRLAIGAIGATFVITQYHTAMMFAPNIVGTAQATTAGWGNLGGGVTQMAMPLLLAAIMTVVADQSLGWRLAMVVPGIGLLLTGFAYYFLTQDCPEGNFRDLRAQGRLPANPKSGGSFLAAARDYRVWALFLIYGACFGVELTIDNIAALHFHDQFALDLKTAGLIAGLFGLMNIFARSLGGWSSDLAARRFGLNGRKWVLFAIILAEGISLMIFSQMDTLTAAVALMMIFGLFVCMGCGATYGLVPFINRQALGPVAGIVGAGGNVGALLAGFLFRMEGLLTTTAMLIIGVIVTVLSAAALGVRFSEQTQAAEQAAFEEALRERATLRRSPGMVGETG